ncbi:protein of unknown function [Lutibacter oricola]|uniref:Collagen-binding domain of a collagenase n=1 Tax=Lutibacter oricola TaxID=762486 RepID=A0A1H2SV10_9FLAO|nr:DUF5060 domain-containing protein [Lutibacter oricola]SDW35503.1 protein of unknown function [Lutibacter oricola]
MKNYLSILLVLLFSASVSTYSASPIKSKFITIEKWEVLDVNLKSSGKVKSPFNVDLSANFIHEDGEEMKISGFYNGGKEWILRFSSSKPGKWIYTTKSSNKGLNNKKGTVVVLDKNSKNHHGEIIVDPKNPEYFIYEDGTPYFLMAFECDWMYALDYKNEEGIPKTDHLLNLISENGFNQVVTTVFSYDVDWKKSPQYWPKDEKLQDYPEHEYGAPKDIYPFLGNNVNPDFSSLNIDYFKKLDRVVASMHDKNIVAHLMIYVWNKLVSWPEPNSESDKMYFDYVIKRYQAYPNILWDISKEAMLYGTVDESFFLEKIERVRKADAFSRLVTVHDFGFCKRNEDKVDFISRQDWSYLLYDKMLDNTNTYKNKPVFNIEHGGYEESPYEVFTGFYTDAETCLDRNYQCAFSGSYSTYYWQAASWDVIIHNAYKQPESFKKPRFEYFKHFTNFFKKHTFSDYKPFPKKNMAGYCMKGNEDNYILYMPKSSYRIFTGWLFEKKIKTRTIQWFNTLTGEYSKEEKITKKSVVTSPWYKEAAVILVVK